MRSRSIRQISLLVFLASLGSHVAARADGDLNKVKHVIVMMQENHSFDNYFGVLPYVPGGPYHAGPCHRNDHRCVDGLSCEREGSGLECRNWNRDADARGRQRKVFSFHSRNYCPGPDLDHGWPGSHQEANFQHPTKTLRHSPNDGFVRVNDATSQPDVGGESPTEDDTMGYYDQTDLPFYYGLAQTFALSDRYFQSVLGPTLPNRAYQLAGTSFGHLTTAEIVPPLVPPPGGYKPITGTILDLLDQHRIGWANFFSDAPTTGIFRGTDPTHLIPVQFLAAFANPQVCGLPPVSFVDPALGFMDPTIENDEHPPTNIRKGQLFISGIVNTIRNSACWKDSVIFFTYDEHGGFYDHVAPPPAAQGGAPNPDGIDPGLCADASAPGSEQPGAGQQCAASKDDAKRLCPEFTPAGPYPRSCPNFDQLGFRVPFVAVSPFSKPGYVSHVVSDHTSMLAFLEKRFLRDATGARPHLTLRDLHASTLEDLFDFDGAPSLNAPVSTAPDPLPNDPGCPFVPAVP